MMTRTSYPLGRHEVLLVLGCACLAGLVVLQDRYRLTFVQGTSMQPTLATGDLLIVRKHAYDRAEPVRGDLVVANYQDGLIIKRVVGLPGEEVEIKNGTLFIGDRPLPEGHGIRAGPVNILKGKLFEGKFAILGDNRAIPPGQFVHAVVTKDQILGKVILIIHVPTRKSRDGPEPET
jgi:signal peptidase I